jgi:hypothetical protein
MKTFLVVFTLVVSCIASAEPTREEINEALLLHKNWKEIALPLLGDGTNNIFPPLNPPSYECKIFALGDQSKNPVVVLTVRLIRRAGAVQTWEDRKVSMQLDDYNKLKRRIAETVNKRETIYKLPDEVEQRYQAGRDTTVSYAAKIPGGNRVTYVSNGRRWSHQGRDPSQGVAIKKGRATDPLLDLSGALRGHALREVKNRRGS